MPKIRNANKLFNQVRLNKLRVAKTKGLDKDVAELSEEVAILAESVGDIDEAIDIINGQII